MEPIFSSNAGDLTLLAVLVWGALALILVATWRVLHRLAPKRARHDWQMFGRRTAGYPDRPRDPDGRE